MRRLRTVPGIMPMTKTMTNWSKGTEERAKR